MQSVSRISYDRKRLKSYLGHFQFLQIYKYHEHKREHYLSSFEPEFSLPKTSPTTPCTIISSSITSKHNIKGTTTKSIQS